MHGRAEFGLLVVGDEILSGKRADKHLARVIEELAARGMSLAWYRVAGDGCRGLSETLCQTQQQNLPVLCFGGIGATPDDNTRQAAADAFGCRLEIHAEALALIEAQFGADARPNRVRMAELPEACLLIPNPINRIPGFTLYEHHFFPGFPNMAWPMLDWVLETYYPSMEEKTAECSVQIRGTPESSLYELMESLSVRHGRAQLFSLPHMGVDSYIELGFRGKEAILKKAFAELLAELRARKLPFELVGGD
jgi:molybdopterin-biosynthesis enzyme MoeA-like protein